MGSNHYRRIVVKVGSQVLCDDAGALNVPVLASLVREMEKSDRAPREALSGPYGDAVSQLLHGPEACGGR